MRKHLIILTTALSISSCTVSDEQHSLIPDPSAEKGSGSTVAGWNA